MPKRVKFLLWVALTVLLYLAAYRLDAAVASMVVR